MHARDQRVQKLDRLQDVAAVLRVLLEDLVLFLCQLAGLVQVHDAADLADVVHQRRLANDLDVCVAQPELDREDLCVGGHPRRMPGRVAVHLVDRAREAPNGLLEGRLKVFVESRVLDGGGGAIRRGVQELALPLVEALALGVAERAQEPDGVAARGQAGDRQRLRRGSSPSSSK